MWKFIKEMLKSIININKIEVKPFNIKLCETIDRAEKAITTTLYSNLPIKDRLQIAYEILYIIDDMRELQAIKLKEDKKLWEAAYFTNHSSFGWY